MEAAAGLAHGRMERKLNGTVQDAIETLNKGAGVLERYAFHQKGLVKKEPGGVLGDGIVGA